MSLRNTGTFEAVFRVRQEVTYCADPDGRARNMAAVFQEALRATAWIAPPTVTVDSATFTPEPAPRYTAVLAPTGRWCVKQAPRKSEALLIGMTEQEAKAVATALNALEEAS